MKKSFIILTPSTVLLSLSHFQVFLCLTVFVFNLPAKKRTFVKNVTNDCERSSSITRADVDEVQTS